MEICPIYKKGDVQTRDDRAVTLLCTTHKILTEILYVKIVPYADEIIAEYEGVFQKGRSTVDQFLLREKY